MRVLLFFFFVSICFNAYQALYFRKIKKKYEQFVQLTLQANLNLIRGIIGVRDDLVVVRNNQFARSRIAEKLNELIRSSMPPAETTEKMKPTV